MKNLFIFLVAFTIISCDEVTYFIVRHAEKDISIPNDPPLTAEGEKQAKDLMYMLQEDKIKHIFSTNYKRTLATAAPSSDFFGLKTEIYDPKKLDEFVASLKEIKDGNVIIVSHSNVVDDLVNQLMGETKVAGDLPETEYGIVYKVKRSGSSYSFERFVLPKATAR